MAESPTMSATSDMLVLRGVGRFPYHRNVVGAASKQYWHVVRQAVTVIATETVDGRYPYVSIGIARDISHKIVCQTVFCIDCLEENVCRGTWTE